MSARFLLAAFAASVASSSAMSEGFVGLMSYLTEGPSEFRAFVSSLLGAIRFSFRVTGGGERAGFSTELSTESIFVSLVFLVALMVASWS